MIKQIIGLLILLFLLSSCICGYIANGKVIDNQTLKPIKNARISISGLDTIYTDINGLFKINEVTHANVDFNLLIEKEGYLQKYVHLSEQINSESFVIKIEKTQNEIQPSISIKTIERIYIFNKYVISIFNIFTFLFLVFNRKIIKRFFWILGVLFCNLTIYFSYLDLSFSHFNLINGPIFTTHFSYYPFTVCLAIPVVSIVFWILYFFKPILIRVDTNQ